ncbi:MAG: sigma-70 family RNA polymerase sigma factor [Chitinophagales bacterium]|nr:sigma-70 family RNA polymerase sigma factor [Chitinophagales bacterium]
MAERETYHLLDTKDGLSVLYSRYGRKLYSYGIVHWQLSEDESWDLVYKTLYKILETYGKYQFESEKKFGSFTFKIFVNYLRNHYRDQKRVAEQLSFVNFHESEFESGEQGRLANSDKEVKQKIAKESLKEEMAETSENPALAALKEELDKLQDWERILLLLRSQDMPYSEISKHIEKPEGQLKVYYQRLKEKIMKRLSGKMVLKPNLNGTT